MKLKLALTFLALCLCAAAQTLADLKLSGPFSDLTITNNSNQPVIAAMVLYFGADGKELTGAERLFVLDRPNYLGVGDSEKINTFTKGKGAEHVASARVTAVIFSDGKFVGGDDDESTRFRQGMEQRFQSMRSVFQLAKSGEWDKVKALYDADINGDMWKAAAASRLLRARDKGIGLPKQFGNLPASTWKGSLLNKLRIPEAFQAIADWFMPTVYATLGDHSYCCTVPWPQDTSTDSYHPTEWTYYCSDSNPDIPCPGVGQETPFEGIAATCTAIPPAFAYTTGTQIDFAQDLRAVWIQVGASGTSNIPYTLDVKGSCHDNSGFYPPEYAEYTKYCEDTPSYVPHKVSDTTKNICGATATGYM